MPQYSSIAFATDFSEHSELAAVRAQSLASASGAELGVIHVAPYAHPSYIAAQLPPDIALRDTLVGAGESKLAEWLTRLNIEVANRWVEFGTPAAEILKLTKPNGIDLLVIGSSGTGALHALIGTTALSVIANATCDVLVTTPAPQSEG